MVGRNERTGRCLGVVCRLALLLGLLLPLAGCDAIERFRLTPDRVIIEQTPDVAYEQLFPHYVELCAVSQWHRRDGRRGNPFGHAVMYLKGGCKDEQAAFPQLRRCRHAATDLGDPEHGAGVSVGRWFRNVNWIATPGHALFFEGNLAPGERLTEGRSAETVRQAIAAGVFDGVELHRNWTREPEWTLAEFVADQSIGTDFALRYARNVFCARMPVTEPVLDEIIAFLNDKNREYATGEADYNWSLFANNCVHTVRNALAAANTWSAMSVLRVKAMHLLNLAVPANEFVNLAILGRDGPIEDDKALFADDPLRDALNDFRWLPTRPGAVLKTLPVHQPNDLYDTTFRLFAIQSPWSRGKTAYAVRLLADPESVDLETNLRAFRDRYDAILADRGAAFDGLASVRGSPYRRFGRVYAEYITQQRADVDRLLAQLAALPPTTALPRD